MGRTKGGARNRRLRARLYAHQAGKCFWCHRPMLLLNLKGGYKVPYMPEELCTIDHLDPRHSPRRGTMPHMRRKVASCWKCNNERDKRELEALPVAEIHRINGKHSLLCTETECKKNDLPLTQWIGCDFPKVEV